MEADLSRYYGIDYRDRWRRTDGVRGLTLRMIAVRVRALPVDSAVAVATGDGKPHWTLTDLLLDDLRMHLTNSKKNPAKPHPGRPKAKAKRLNPTAIAAGRRRRAARQRAIEAGEIT